MGGVAQTGPPPNGTQALRCEPRFESQAPRLAAALPHLGMARSARFGPGPGSRTNSRTDVASLRKEACRKCSKNLTQFGHLFNHSWRASLRSDNCPNSSDRCPNIFGLGVRIHRNAHPNPGAPAPNSLLATNPSATHFPAPHFSANHFSATDISASDIPASSVSASRSFCTDTTGRPDSVSVPMSRPPWVLSVTPLKVAS